MCAKQKEDGGLEGAFQTREEQTIVLICQGPRINEEGEQQRAQ